LCFEPVFFYGVALFVTLRCLRRFWRTLVVFFFHAVPLSSFTCPLRCGCFFPPLWHCCPCEVALVRLGFRARVTSHPCVPPPHLFFFFPVLPVFEDPPPRVVLFFPCFLFFFFFLVFFRAAFLFVLRDFYLLPSDFPFFFFFFLPLPRFFC